jgi:PKD repeat protein
MKKIIFPFFLLCILNSIAYGTDVDTLIISMQVGDSLIVSKSIGNCLSSDGTYDLDYVLPSGLTFETIMVKENETYGTIHVIFALKSSLLMEPGDYTGQITYAIFRGGSECISKTFELKIKITSALKPIADFNTKYTTITQYGSVNFSNTTQNAVSEWQWAFGDGETSTSKAPTHIYANTGLFTVSLIAIGPAGKDIITKENYITVLAKGTPGILKWSYNTGDDIITTPALGLNEEIFVTSRIKKLFSFNPDGTLRWDYSFDEYPKTPVVGPDGSVFVSDNDGCLQAIDSTGNRLWVYCQDEKLSIPAIGVDSTIYITCNDDSLYALNYNGTKKWAVNMGGSSTGQPLIGIDGSIYVLSYNGTFDNRLISYNPGGQQNWKLQLELSGNSSDTKTSLDNDGTVYVAESNKLYAISREGKIKWNYPTQENKPAFCSTPVIVKDSLIIFGTSIATVIYLEKSGIETNHIELSKSTLNIFTPTLGNKGYLYAIRQTDTLFSLNNETIIWRFGFLPGSYTSFIDCRGGLVDNKGVYYVGNQDGFIYAIQTESDSLSDAPWPKQSCNIYNTNRVLYPAPILASPTNELKDLDINVQLLWSKVAGCKQFIVDFASNPSFSSSITREISDTTTTFSGLQHGKTYYWRVRSDFGPRQSIWTKTRCFTTVSEIPDVPNVPELSSPANGAFDQPTELDLRWEISERAAIYSLQVSNVSDFSTSIIDQDSIIATQCSVIGLTDETTYYWRVSASNEGGTSNWSSVWNFTTVNPTGIDENDSYNYYWLKQNFPNPFDNTSVIEFNIPKSDHVRLVLTDMSGKEILLIDGQLSKGNYQVKVSKNDLHDGLWIYRLSTNEYFKVRKMIVE